MFLHLQTIWLNQSNKEKGNSYMIGYHFVQKVIYLVCHFSTLVPVAQSHRHLDKDLIQTKVFTFNCVNQDVLWFQKKLAKSLTACLYFSVKKSYVKIYKILRNRNKEQLQIIKV